MLCEKISRDCKRRIEKNLLYTKKETGCGWLATISARTVGYMSAQVCGALLCSGGCTQPYVSCGTLRTDIGSEKAMVKALPW